MAALGGGACSRCASFTGEVVGLGLLLSPLYEGVCFGLGDGEVMVVIAIVVLWCRRFYIVEPAKSPEVYK